MPNSVQVHSDPSVLLNSFFEKQTYSQIVVLTDRNTRVHCYPLVKSFIPRHEIIEVEAGETFKNIQTCEVIWQKMTDLKLDRHALVVVLGGGVLGDMGGFCAATYKRGIDFLLLPTTLLAQVDASVGGKLAIDFNGFKNHIGVFQLPVTTLVCPAFLRTLPFRELRSGYAEVIKHCLISDRAMWDQIKKEDVNGQDWEALIRHSVAFKSQVVAEDPREKGRRKILNFGHTIGHALETWFLETDDRLYHGEAIAAGMIAESFIARKKGLLTGDEENEITGYLEKVYGRIRLSDNTGVIEIMKQDKKNKGNKILMALPQGIGNAMWDVEVNEEQVNEALSLFFGLL
ncbi:MAG TPA: 3-dehydroquinate synthase [Cyclobacteriaceae bacterium]|nr:3-dehydroquinate synthase [Cyclobacteriaceae bacterium]